MDAHVISLANQKGGTAKTTTCSYLPQLSDNMH